MDKLKIIIEKSIDYYDAYAENCPGVYGAGSSVEEAKANVLQAIVLLKEALHKSEHPEVLKGEYELEFHFDTQSFLAYYASVFSKPALEKITGIHQKQLHHYASGLRKPREKQRKMIETALHRLGEELLSVRL
jgi:predicted RNase H-like HicB family nuclease